MAVSKEIIRAMLPFVAEYGWSEKSLWMGAESAGYVWQEAQLEVGTSSVKMLRIYLEIVLDDIRDSFPEENIMTLPIKDRMSYIIINHLSLLNRSVVLKTIRILMNPLNGPLALSFFAKIIDAIWRKAGDKSTDFNYYTKRAMLGKIYIPTLIVWLKDRSGTLDGTRKALQLQLDLVLKMPLLFKAIKALNPFKSRD
jgi:ubiquinone biosynthesis protein COQ9